MLVNDAVLNARDNLRWAKRLVRLCDHTRTVQVCAVETLARLFLAGRAQEASYALYDLECREQEAHDADA